MKFVVSSEYIVRLYFITLYDLWIFKLCKIIWTIIQFNYFYIITFICFSYMIIIKITYNLFYNDNYIYAYVIYMLILVYAFTILFHECKLFCIVLKFFILCFYLLYIMCVSQVKMAVHDIWLLSMTDYAIISKGEHRPN
jgi:hypothetical protein